MAPPAPGDTPLSDALLEAMDDAGFSRRGLAAELQRRRPRKDIESWRGTVRDYLSSKATPGPTIARLLAEILGKPADHFVRPPQRETRHDEVVRLRAENARLKRLLEAAGTIVESAAGQS